MPSVKSVCLVLGAICASATQAQWRAFILHPVGNERSAGVGVNATEVVGTVRNGTTTQAVVWDGTEPEIRFLAPGSTNSYPSKLRGSTVVGGQVIVGGISHAVTWPTTKSPYTVLRENAAIFGVGGGQQVGASGTTSGRAALWSGSPGSYVSLHPIGATESHAYATDGKQQVGTTGNLPTVRPFLWAGSAESGLDLTPPWATVFGNATGYVRDVEDGWQVGAIRPNGYFVEYAVLWNNTPESGVLLHPYGFGESVANAVAGGYQFGYLDFMGGFKTAALWKGSKDTFEDLGSFIQGDYVWDSEAVDAYVSGGQVRVVGKSQNRAVLWVKESVAEQLPSSVTVVEGTYQHGNNISLRRSDSDWIIYRLQPGTTTNRASVEFAGVAPMGTNRFNLSIECKCPTDGDGADANGQIQLFNFLTNKWEIVRRQEVPDEVNRFIRGIVDDAGPYIQPGSRTVKGRIVVETNTNSDAKNLWIDRVYWGFPN